MAARDSFHDAFVNGLKKEGWTITHDPLSIKIGGIELSIDLGAEKLIAAEKNNEKIAVEIKSFIKPSAISEFHTAVGQYMNYRKALKNREPERKLYLAVPFDTYKSFFTLQFIQEAVLEYEIKLIVYNVKKEVIDKWIK